ncbi:hypothetical protein LX32DRAFT_282892 [Colletotrichum zoysiae]|uniref:Uncharacterized protein n=1 Tax=Colletotrichum zoysiae TaxID=1216348 RepID=A0AAD9HNW6_9PEZI|nr:hypothetical protein LX32DRAFT_282892 [Colletotrichum zoysiae]
MRVAAATCTDVTARHGRIIPQPPYHEGQFFVEVQNSLLSILASWAWGGKRTSALPAPYLPQWPRPRLLLASITLQDHAVLFFPTPTSRVQEQP